MDEHFAKLDSKIDALGQKIDGLGGQLHQEIDNLGTQLRREIDGLGRQMRVLHEETQDNIRAVTADPEETRRQFEAADSKLLEGINSRLDPIETWAKNARPRRRG